MMVGEALGLQVPCAVLVTWG